MYGMPGSSASMYGLPNPMMHPAASMYGIPPMMTNPMAMSHHSPANSDIGLTMPLSQQNTGGSNIWAQQDATAAEAAAANLESHGDGGTTHLDLLCPERIESV